MATKKVHRNTWRLSATLYFRYYTDTDKSYWIRSSSGYDTKSRLTSSIVIRLMIENKEKIDYGLKNNRDVFFTRRITSGGSVSLGYDGNKNLKLFITGNSSRYEKGAGVALSKEEYSVFLEKSNRIADKMKVYINITYSMV